MKPSAPSRLPLISLFVAADALALPLIGAGLARFGIVPPVIGFFVAVAGVLPALAAAVLASVSLRRHGHSPQAMTALFLGGGFIITVIALIAMWSGFPVMNDVTTDLDDPVRLAARDGSDIRYPSRFVALQRAGYPDLGSVRFENEMDDVLEAASASARGFGWEIVATEPGEGRVVAVATTAMFGFRDDIAIRIRSVGGESVVDVRSRSRVGRSDLGANARRIRRFLSDLQVRLR